MGFRIRPGETAAKVIQAAIRLCGGLMILTWSLFALWLSWKLATHIFSFLGRTVFSKPW